MADSTPSDLREETIQAIRDAQALANRVWEIQEREAHRGERISRTFTIGQMVYVWRGDHEGWGVIDGADELGYIAISWCSADGDFYGGSAWVLPSCISTRRVPCSTPECQRSGGHPPGHLINGKWVQEP